MIIVILSKRVNNRRVIITQGQRQIIMQMMQFIKVPKMVKATYQGVILLILLALFSGFLFSVYEGHSLGQSLYWALVTMTTVGYGDVYPTTAGSKVVSVFLACSGILLYGYLGAVIMTFFAPDSI